MTFFRQPRLGRIVLGLIGESALKGHLTVDEARRLERRVRRLTRGDNSKDRVQINDELRAIRQHLRVLSSESLGRQAGVRLAQFIRGVRLARASSIIVPPGAQLRRVLEFAYSRKTMTTVFDPALADMQDEWRDAMVAGARWKSRWIRIRGYYSLASAAGLHSVVRVIRRAVGLWKAS